MSEIVVVETCQGQQEFIQEIVIELGFLSSGGNFKQSGYDWLWWEFKVYKESHRF